MLRLLISPCVAFVCESMWKVSKRRGSHKCDEQQGKRQKKLRQTVEGEGSAICIYMDVLTQKIPPL